MSETYVVETIKTMEQPETFERHTHLDPEQIRVEVVQLVVSSHPTIDSYNFV